MAKHGWPRSAVAARVRVIVDNDFSGDPDGLVQLAHHLLSPSVDIRALIGTRMDPHGWAHPTADHVGTAVAEAERIARLCDRTDVPIVRGADAGLPDHRTPVETDGVRAIIDEAMRDDPRPLFVACGASLTEVASAWLLEPRIAERLTVVWIGGHEYEAPVAPGAPDLEYNLGIDRIAAQVVFNESALPVWQFPRDAYRQALASRAELQLRMGTAGRLGRHLLDRLGGTARRLADAGTPIGEVYVLGDSPLVLATALLTSFEPDAASCSWEVRPCPRIGDDGLYVQRADGRPIRVFTRIDNRLWLEDLLAKLQLHAPR